MNADGARLIEKGCNTTMAVTRICETAGSRLDQFFCIGTRTWLREWGVMDDSLTVLLAALIGIASAVWTHEHVLALGFRGLGA